MMTVFQLLYICVFEIDRRKEGNVLFNDALNTFYLGLYGVKHTVKDHSDSERGNPLRPHRAESERDRETERQRQRERETNVYISKMNYKSIKFIYRNKLLLVS